MSSSGGGGAKGKRNKKKQYFQKQHKGRLQLSAGLRGFLLFCDNQDKAAVQEGYNVLNEWADKTEWPKEEEEGEDDQEEKEEEEDEDDLEAALEKEKATLQAEWSKPADERRFQSLSTGVHNTHFIRTTLPDPLLLAQNLFRHVAETGEQRTRHLLRLVPVQLTAKAHDDQLKRMAPAVIKRYFGHGRPVKFAVVFRSRLSNTLTQQEAVLTLRQAIRDVNCVAEFDYKKPDLVVLVEVMKGMLCLGVLPDFYKFRKYNLVELAKQKLTADLESDGKKAADAENEEPPSKVRKVQSDVDAEESKNEAVMNASDENDSEKASPSSDGEFKDEQEMNASSEDGAAQSGGKEEKPSPNCDGDIKEDN